MEVIGKKVTTSKSLMKGMNRLKRSFDRRNAEIRKIVTGEFKVECMLFSQKEFKSHVKAFEKMLIDLNNI